MSLKWFLMRDGAYLTQAGWSPSADSAMQFRTREDAEAVAADFKKLHPATMSGAVPIEAEWLGHTTGFYAQDAAPTFNPWGLVE
jgi:hypothetical protein